VILVAIEPYYVKWVGKQPEKIAFQGQEAPPEFSLRCDIRMLVDGVLVGISLSKSSTKSQLSQYLKFLKKSGFRPNQVVTRVRSKTVANPHGRFPLAIFDCIGTVEDLQKPAAVDVTPIRVETEPPKAAQAASNNPWA